MSNFNQTCYIATDYNTKAPILEERATQTGTPIFSGKITWSDGKDKDGKTRYQSIRFFTFNRRVFELMKSNSSDALDVEGFLKVKYPKDKNGNIQTFVEIQVVDARIHTWEKKREPVKSFQEVDNEQEILF